MKALINNINITGIVFLLLLIISCSGGESEDRVMDIKISSPAFQDGGMIPKLYSCDDKNISPPLNWSNLPPETKSIAIIVDDPDAPVGTWVHWVIYNISPDTSSLEEAVPAEKILPNGAYQGKNDWGRIGYGGPCPPGGTHRYFFKIYALDSVPELKPGINKAELLKAINGHIISEGKIIGKYKR